MTRLEIEGVILLDTSVKSGEGALPAVAGFWNRRKARAITNSLYLR